MWLPRRPSTARGASPAPAPPSTLTRARSGSHVPHPTSPPCLPLDPPPPLRPRLDFFWEAEEYEKLYRRVHRYLDVEDRTSVRRHAYRPLFELGRDGSHGATVNLSAPLPTLV